MLIYSHHGKKGSHPYNTPCLLFCRAVTSWLASLKSSGFSSFYNAIVLMGAQEAWRWCRICTSQAGIPQHCLFSLALPYVIRKLCSFLYPGGWCGFVIADIELLTSPMLSHGALDFTLPSHFSLEQSIMYWEKIDPSIDPLQWSFLLCCFKTLGTEAQKWGRGKSRRKGEKFSAISFTVCLLTWHQFNLLNGDQ